VGSPESDLTWTSAVLDDQEVDCALSAANSLLEAPDARLARSRGGVRLELRTDGHQCGGRAELGPPGRGRADAGAGESSPVSRPVYSDQLWCFSAPDASGETVLYTCPAGIRTVIKWYSQWQEGNAEFFTATLRIFADTAGAVYKFAFVENFGGTAPLLTAFAEQTIVLLPGDQVRLLNQDGIGSGISGSMGCGFQLTL
jgi:hypothetical protein